MGRKAASNTEGFPSPAKSENTSMLIKQLFAPAIHFYWKFGNRMDIYFGNRPKHVVICGYPRSGTSLLYNMISASIKGFHCEEFEKHALQRLHHRGNYVTKCPLDILNVDKIVNNNPLSKDIYFLVLVRDVRDIITSRHPLIPDKYFIDYKNSWLPRDPQFSDWNHDAPGIEAIHHAMQECMSRQDINLLKIHYENVVNDADCIQKQIADFTNIQFTESFSDFYKRPHKHAYKYSGRYQAKDASLVRESERADKSRISKWRNPEHAQSIHEQFSSYPELFDILISEGYEKDKDWFVNRRGGGNLDSISRPNKRSAGV